MSRKKKPSRAKRVGRAASRDEASTHQADVRIIGGRFKGTRLVHLGDQRTRPMKHRVREATFNLVGPAVRGMHAVDLFAGTGALALEAISRGAAEATMIERHFPTARCIEQNIALLSIEARTTVFAADTFIWAQPLPDLGPAPWLVLCSPPYSFYEERLSDMLGLIRTFVDRSPPDSILVVESDDRLDVECLPQPDLWDVRSYPPAVIAVYQRDSSLPQDLRRAHETPET